MLDQKLLCWGGALILNKGLAVWKSHQHLSHCFGQYRCSLLSGAAEVWGLQEEEWVLVAFAGHFITSNPSPSLRSISSVSP